MHFSEPVTTLTDYALGTVSLYFAIALLRAHPPKWRSVRLWSIGFFASAVAAFVGGTFHALKFQVADSVLNALWNITIYSIGASGAFMVSGVLVSSIHRYHKSRRPLLNGIWITLAGVLIQQSGVPLHNDIFHITQIVALYFFFSGARLLEDRVPPR
jgi:uncharacterized protein DUF6962